ncbi:MAG: hypothetical protein NW205_10460 [Hyphomicrobiaceae bacterium]|nr:hypothetical protein [Hyphomicrobiaceae bacterium]
MAVGGTTRRGERLDFGDEPDWAEPEAPPRDWKKIILVVGLGVLSWVATYVGMLELIEANMGDLPLIHKAIIGFSVAMLMIMIIWLLDQMFSPIGFTTKVIYAAGYIFLTLISVGFGFGFYWKVLESRSESTRSAESAIAQVQGSLHAGATRLQQLNATLAQLQQMSAAKAIDERDKGTTCPASRPGDGPRRKLREEDAQRFAFASEFVKGRIDSINVEMTALEGDLTKVLKDDKSTIDSASGTRNDFMRGVNRRLDMTVTGFNAFRTDPQLRQIRQDLAERADRTLFPTGSGNATFSCPDAQLQAALKGVVRAIDQLPEMRKPQIAAVEGSEATIEAFRRLTATLQGALVFDLPPSADELRELQKKAVQSVSDNGAATAAAIGSEPVGLSKRDYVPLAIALFVDLCLLLVSIGRPMNRLNGLVPVMREAERGPMIKILSRFNDIHRDAEIRQNFEVFRHVVFDLHGAYYVAVPLDAPYRPTGRAGQGGYGAADAQDLQHEAHLLANLFTGFERQRIFARVYNPFLTTGTIQRILFRQGSKFAGCKAFRVYRFRDGEWSNMILQAVMGAARRAEEGRRKSQRREDEVAERLRDEFEERLQTAVREATERAKTEGRMAAVEALASRRARDDGAATASPERRHGAIDTRLRATPGRDGIRLPDAEEAPATNGKSADVLADFVPRSERGGIFRFNGIGRGRRAPAQSEASLAAAAAAAAGPRPLHVNGHGAAAPKVNAGSPGVAAAAAAPAGDLAFGRYAARAARELAALPEEADGETEATPVATRAANSNTAPVAPPVTGVASEEVRPARESVVTVMPSPRFAVIDGAGSGQDAAGDALEAGAPSATVTLTRETATFTVPVSEARLPRILTAAAPKAVATAASDGGIDSDTEAEAIAAPARALVPPPLPAWARLVPAAAGATASADADRFEPCAAQEERDGLPASQSVDSDEATVTIARRLKPITEDGP